MISHCNNTLPRGVVYWTIRPLRQFAPWGPRDCLRAILRAAYFQCIPTRGSVLIFLFPEMGIWVERWLGSVDSVKFNTLPLRKKECILTSYHKDYIIHNPGIFLSIFIHQRSVNPKSSNISIMKQTQIQPTFQNILCRFCSSHLPHQQCFVSTDTK